MSEDEVIITDAELAAHFGAQCQCGCECPATYLVKGYEYHPRALFIEPACLSAMRYLVEASAEFNFPVQSRPLAQPADRSP